MRAGQVLGHKPKAPGQSFDAYPIVSCISSFVFADAAAAATTTPKTEE
jgi:hypothetical protein